MDDFAANEHPLPPYGANTELSNGLAIIRNRKNWIA